MHARLTVLMTAAAALTCATAMAQASDTDDPILQELSVNYYTNKYRVSAEEALARIQLQDRASGIEDRVETILGSLFAGVWYDPLDRGRLKIGITRAGESLRQSVLNAVREQGVSDSTDLVAVSYTQPELERIQNSARDSLMDMILAGHAQTSQNPKLNAVVVTALASLSAEEERRIGAFASQPGVSIQRVTAETLVGRAESCGVWYCNSPMRGGRYIQAVYDACTSGFMARHKVNKDHLLILTAGHCVWAQWNKPYTHFWAYFPDGSSGRIGDVYGYVLGGSGGRDAGVVHIDPNDEWGTQTPLAAVVVKASSMTTYNPTYPIKADSGSTLGKLLCMTGMMTYTRCAEVSDLYTDQVVETNNGTEFLLKNMNELDTCHTKYNDSGAPIYKGNKAYGIHIGSVGGPFHCYTFYQGVRGAQTALNVELLLNTN